MKKAYAKPGICVENFALSQSIAMSCGLDRTNSTTGVATHGSPETCGWSIGGDTIWLESTGVCTDYDDLEADLGIGCYNGPMGDFTVFAS